MKKSVLSLVISVLLTTSSVFSQTLMDYVSSVRGDTLVIKDYYEMKNESNSLRFALMLDTMNVPAGRVYMLKANGYYPSSAITLPPDKAVTIVGEDTTILVNNKNPNPAPPLICGEVCECSSFSFGINVSKELTIKNCALTPAAADQSLGWSIINITADDAKLTVDNCMMERTRWAFISSRDVYRCSIELKNCYFVNMSGSTSRLYGGVIDLSNCGGGTLLVENCTHIMAQGPLYNIGKYALKDMFFNHNTFINCSGNIIKTLGYQSYMVVTNNIFVNSNVQPYYPGMDYDGTDVDSLPMGIINVHDLPPEMEMVDRKILVYGKVVYWDPRLNDMVSILNTNQVNNRTDWTSQMITMNDRTQEMFDKCEWFPFLSEYTWYNELPLFKDSKNLLTDQVDVLKEWSLKSVDTTNTAFMPDWRLVNKGEGSYIYSDWPIPIDLSYTNPGLLNAAVGAEGSFPLGDLNWFPVKKEEWNAQREDEYSLLVQALNSISFECYTQSVENTGIPAKEFSLGQNYPNPFNPTTKIKYTVPDLSPFSKKSNGNSRGGFITFRVYDILGSEVATLVNGYKKPGNYEVEFNGSNLPSGVYFYQIRFENNTISRKMVLVK